MNTSARMMSRPQTDILAAELLKVVRCKPPDATSTQVPRPIESPVDEQDFLGPDDA